MDYPFYCPGCGRSGTEDDGCELGGECPDEACDGTIVASPRDYSICIDNPNGGHGPLRAADDQGDIPFGHVEIACERCGTTTGVKIPDELEWN